MAAEWPSILREEFFHFASEAFARVQVSQIPLFVHQPHRRDARDAEFLAEFILPARLEMLRPGHFFAFHHRFQFVRSEEHTSELQSLAYLVCRLLLEKKKK